MLSLRKRTVPLSLAATGCLAFLLFGGPSWALPSPSSPAAPNLTIDQAELSDAFERAPGIVNNVDAIPVVMAPPTVYSLSSSVDAYRTARSDVIVAEQELADAQSARALVERELTRASLRSADAQAVAVVAQDDVNVLARNMYMGNNMSSFEKINAVLSAKSPTEVTDTMHLLESVSTVSATELVEDVAQADVAQQAYADAMSKNAESALRVQTANVSLAESVARRDATRAVLASLLAPAPVSGPQVGISPALCPRQVPDGSFRVTGDPYELCARSVEQAPTQAAALAIIEAFRNLGAPYACGGVGRLEEYRFDCSSFVSRAYFEGAGIPVASSGYAPSTRSMVPWDGHALDPWFSYVSPEDSRPGDLVAQRSCTQEPCIYQHVVMLLADGAQIHTSSCGDVANVSTFAGFDAPNFLVTRRVAVPQGSQVDVDRVLLQLRIDSR
jgi:cell wall-associated NlpC family hydrolase